MSANGRHLTVVMSPQKQRCRPPPHHTTTAIRPWFDDFLSLSSLSLPVSFHSLSHRIQHNLHTFHTNYLFIFQLTLITHPFTFFLFLAIILPSIHLLVNHHHPLLLFGFEFGQRLIAVILALVVILSLTVTHVWWNVFLSVLVSAIVVLLHASFRTPDDVMEESPYCALLSVIDEDENARGPYTLV
ncbi:PRA1 family protein D-like [Bidens hawaiensis]|uniref:PRA1 family protein D-like n=1 Tax=Bidens hawaiensis TaxID=980011 RepID=UPI00404A545B